MQSEGKSNMAPATNIPIVSTNEHKVSCTEPLSLNNETPR